MQICLSRSISKTAVLCVRFTVHRLDNERVPRRFDCFLPSLVSFATKRGASIAVLAPKMRVWGNITDNDPFLSYWRCERFDDGSPRAGVSKNSFYYKIHNISAAVVVMTMMMIGRRTRAIFPAMKCAADYSTKVGTKIALNDKVVGTIVGRLSREQRIVQLFHLALGLRDDLAQDFADHVGQGFSCAGVQ